MNNIMKNGVPNITFIISELIHNLNHNREAQMYHIVYRKLN